MGAIAVRQKRGGSVPTGSSKLFGSPDVPENFDWPAVADATNCYDLDFICQLNCSELSPYDRKRLLPDKGMLYFFYDFAESPGLISDENAARVIYSTEENLEQLTMVDANGVDCALCPPKALSFSRLTKGAAPPHILLPLSPEADEGLTMLLCLSSFRIERGFLHFTDVGRLCFLIEDTKLAERNFSDVRVKISGKSAD